MNLVLFLSSEGEDGGNSVVAYYQSEFSVPIPQQDSLDKAIESLEPSTGSLKGGKGRALMRPSDGLSVNSVISRGLSTQTLSFK